MLSALSHSKHLAAYFIFSFLLQVSVIAKTPTYWLLEGTQKNYRHFLKIEKVNTSYKVLELAQERGDFPSIVVAHDLKTQEELAGILSHYNKIKVSEVTEVGDWSIEESIQDARTEKRGASTIPKGLFGKRNKELWKATQVWSEAWEIKYAEWVEKNVKENFFSQYNISTDCADAVLGIRWIFARIHGLPVANHIANSSSLLTNYSVPRAWRYLDRAEDWKKDELFMTALNYVMTLASTRTIKNDSYPVALTKQGLRVGAFLLTESQESNHVKLISENNFDDPTDLPLFTLASTVPRKVRLMVREVVTDQGWPKLGEKSFLKFRWPIVTSKSVYLKSSESHSDYSEEQFSEELRTEFPVFIEFLLGRLKDSYDPSKLIELALEDILEYVQQRIQVVEEGAAFCQVNDCSPGTANWDAWSTPSRDKKLKDKFANMDLLATQFEDLSPGLVERWEDAQAQTKVGILKFNLSLKTIRHLLEIGHASSDPQVSVEKRWGIDLEGTGKELLAEIKELLKTRKQTIESQWEECNPTDCFPKTAKWLSWNTFKTDEALVAKYNDLNQMCEAFGRDVCFDILFDDTMTFDSGVEALTLREWVNRIPFLYSNLDVSLERRWGDLEEKTKAVILAFEKSLAFSSSDLVLIDGKVLKDLESNQVLYKAKSNEQITLSKNGEVLVQNLETKVLKYGVLGTRGELSFTDLEPISTLSELKVDAFKTTGQWKIVEILNQDQRSSSTVIFDSKGKIIRNLTPSRSSEDFIFLSATSEVFSLSSGQITDFSNVLNNAQVEGRKVDLKKLTPLAVEGGQSLFSYRDENYGVSYPLLIEGNELKTFGLGTDKNITVDGFDLGLGVFFLQHKVSDEFPKAYLALLEAGNLNLTLLGNSFSQVVQVGEEFYFSTLKGSEWDQNRIPEFKRLTTRNIFDITPGNGLTVSHFGKEGVFFNGVDVYTLGDFIPFAMTSHEQLASRPSFLRQSGQLCSNVHSKAYGYLEQMSYQHGDYNCFGTSYRNEEKAKPVFSQKFRTNESIFKNLSGTDGQLIESVGPKTFVWWSKKYKE